MVKVQPGTDSIRPSYCCGAESRYPNLRIILAANDNMALGAASAVVLPTVLMSVLAVSIILALCIRLCARVESRPQ